MIKNIFKGMIIGLANIIPGVSGGTMAVSMGIYDTLIHCISHFLKDIKKNLVFLVPLLVGMGIAIVASSFGIDYLFQEFPVQTNLAFIGLILGSLPTVYEKVRKHTIRLGYVVAAGAFFLIVVGMALLNGLSGHATTIDMNVGQVLVLFLVGVIASATMVIPGVSGSMMLLLLGYYNPVLDTIQTFTMSVVHRDGTLLMQSMFVLVPFGIGVLVGIVAIAKIIEFVFGKFPLYAYWAIIGLLVASPIAILLVGEFPKITILHCITGVIAFLFGWIVSRNLGEKEE